MKKIKVNVEFLIDAPETTNLDQEFYNIVLNTFKNQAIKVDFPEDIFSVKTSAIKGIYNITPKN